MLYNSKWIITNFKKSAANLYLNMTKVLTLFGQKTGFDTNLTEKIISKWCWSDVDSSPNSQNVF